jgi:hypothetical protein
MRILVLFFALMGAMGSGCAGLGALEDIKKVEHEIEYRKTHQDEPAFRLGQDDIRHLEWAAYGLVAGFPLGVVGGVLALARKGKIASVLLLGAYATPLIILAVTLWIEPDDDRFMAFWTRGLVVSGVLLLFVRPSAPRKSTRKAGIPEDTDMVG